MHLKPKTVIKNYSCAAALVAISPVTSGLAAWEVLNSSLLRDAMSASSSSTTTIQNAIISNTIPTGGCHFW